VPSVQNERFGLIEPRTGLAFNCRARRVVPSKIPCCLSRAIYDLVLSHPRVACGAGHPCYRAGQDHGKRTPPVARSNAPASGVRS